MRFLLKANLTNSVYLKTYLNVLFELCIFTAMIIELSSVSRDLNRTNRERVNEHSLKLLNHKIEKRPNLKNLNRVAEPPITGYFSYNAIKHNNMYL